MHKVDTMKGATCMSAKGLRDSIDSLNMMYNSDSNFHCIMILKLCIPKQ